MNLVLPLAALLVVADPAKVPPPVNAVAYSADGKHLFAAANRMIVFDASGNVVTPKNHTDTSVTAIAVAADAPVAVAVGRPGEPSAVRVGDRAMLRPKDTVNTLAYSPNSKYLAAASYDRVVYLLGEDKLKPRELRDHSDAVYGVAFHPDGKLLATCAADRTVKVWDADTGKRLYTLGEATDWLYTVAWSPDGKHIAAAGVDKTIRVWRVTSTEGKLIIAQFAHEAPVTKLAYSPDGKTIYTSAENRTLKAWHADTLTEKKVYAMQSDTVLALAVRPDGKQLALGRYDGTLALLDPTTGTMTDVLPTKPKPPTVTKTAPDFGQRGRTVTVEVSGRHLDGVTAVTADGASAKIKSAEFGRIAFDLDLPATLATGRIALTLKSEAGTATTTFYVDPFPTEPTPNAATLVSLDRTFVGAIDRAGEADTYRFACAEGQEVGVQCVAGGKLEPVLEWLDPAGNIVAERTNGLLAVRCRKAGVHTLAVRDRDFFGDKGRTYRLHVGTIPVVASVFPLGLRAGSEATVRVRGVFLDAPTATVKATADAKPGSKLPVPVVSKNGPVLGSPTVVVGEFPEHGPDTKIDAVPGTANGVVTAPGHIDTWSFRAKKGEPLVIEVAARRHGSPLDPWVEVTDAKGNPVERAVLRGVAKVYTTLRDHDSTAPGIRLESFNEFAMDDYVLIDRELMKIERMPVGPDDDCHFYSVGGNRLAWLGTTPAAHANGSPAYKVQVHPPGSQFPPNGLPLVRLYYRNDDGGPGYGKDAALTFDPPADGEYRVRIGDSDGRSGDGYAYRLTVRPPKPDYAINLSNRTPAVWRGGAVPVGVTVNRIDGFDGPVAVRLEGLPPGFHSAASRVEAGQFKTTLAVWADADVKNPPDGTKNFKIVGEALVAGRSAVRETQAGRPTVVEPGDIVTSVAQKELTIKPGRETTFDVTIERRKDFKGRVPLEVRGMPHGVRVENVGLNGILITERETTRRVILYAEPWVKSATVPLVVLATNEGKGTEHAAPPVTLRIAE